MSVEAREDGGELQSHDNQGSFVGTSCALNFSLAFCNE